AHGRLGYHHSADSGVVFRRSETVYRRHCDNRHQRLMSPHTVRRVLCFPVSGDDSPVMNGRICVKERSFMKKFLFVTLVTLLLTAGVVSAQIVEVTIPDELPEGITVTYWHEWDQAQQQAIDIIINDFNENNPYGITVEQVYQGNTGNLRDQLTAA